jgi:hypothetical protein
VSHILGLAAPAAAAGLYCPYPFANGSRDKYTSDEVFGFETPVASGSSYRCGITSVKWEPGDGFTMLAVRRSGSPASLQVCFHRARRVVPVTRSRPERGSAAWESAILGAQRPTPAVSSTSASLRKWGMTSSAKSCISSSVRSWVPPFIAVQRMPAWRSSAKTRSLSRTVAGLP